MVNDNAEIERLTRLIKQFQGIAKTSRNAKMVADAKSEVKKLTEQLENLDPNAKKLLDNSQSTKPETSSFSGAGVLEKLRSSAVLSRYALTPIHIACTEEDVNIIAMILHAWEKDFASVMNEKHVKLYFSHAAERDSHFHKFNSISHSLNGLIKNYDDYNNAPPNSEFRRQFRDNKERNTRQFLYDSLTHLNKIKDFWVNLDDDTQAGGSTCLNQKEVIILEEKFESPSFLNGKTVAEAISLAATFFKDGINLLSLPLVQKNKS